MNTTYTVQIHDREYKLWSFLDLQTNTPKLQTESESLINPASLKLFSGDLVDLSPPIPTVLESPTKTMQIPGVLLLECNQTYGRTPNNKRLLYKCLPNDPHLPAFLIPFNLEVAFFKKQKNRFVVFRFDNWRHKHPHGILTENLGEVDALPAFYEYQLYCRNVHSHITEFTNAAKQTAKLIPELREVNSRFFRNSMSDTRRHRIFSIDPAGAVDFDDAFSISLDSPFVATLCVYIANVYAWMETMNLWSKFGERVSTIYLPDFKRPMMPNILSDSICSLVADKSFKPTFCMELKINIHGSAIVPGSIRFYNQSVQIDKNYVYESPALLKDPDYILLKRCTALFAPTLNDSHDVVAHWMMQMNSICGKWMCDRGIGIFRQVLLNREETEEPESALTADMPQNTKTLLTNWRNVTGQYVAYDRSSPVAHHTMQTEDYVHITSPIRRLVDLLNQMAFQMEFGLISSVSQEAEDFFYSWKCRLPYINASMRSIRKVQIDCDLVHRCSTHPEWMQYPHRGIIFDRIHMQNGLYSYMVHLSNLNILGRIKTTERYVNYQSLDFRLFMFQDEDKIQRKIRLAIGKNAVLAEVGVQ